MGNRILEFKSRVKENDINKPKIKEILEDKKSTYRMLNHSLTTYQFALCSYANHGEGIQIMNNKWDHLITLDEDDIAHIKRKYLPQLNREMQAKIDAIKMEYKEDIE